MLVSQVLIVAASTPIKLLMGGAAITVGVLVGLVPALLLGMLLGLIPRPRRLRSRRVARAAAPAGPRSPFPLVRTFPAGEPAAPDMPSVVLPPSMRQHIEPEPEQPEELEVAVARERHPGLYDDEYAKQLDHLDTLRRTIRTRLAVGAPPLSDDAPRES
jgi:hypothetical protein